MDTISPDRPVPTPPGRPASRRPRGQTGLRPLGRLARGCHRHARVTIMAWLVLGVTAMILGGVLGGSTATSFVTGATESGRAQQLLAQHAPRAAADTLTLAVHADDPITSPAVRRRVEGALAAIAAFPHVAAVRSPFDVPGQISPGAHTAYAVGSLDVDSSELDPSAVLHLVDEIRGASGDGVALALGGKAVDAAETPGGGAADAVGLVAAMAILLLAFGSVVAMVLPIVTALAAITIGLSGLGLLENAVTTPGFAPVLAAMIGLGVGIDYALFIVTRYREAVASGSTSEDAVVVATSTAGRAVLFAGGTVVVALSGLLLLGLSFMNGVALGCVLMVSLTMAAAVTLLPGLLGVVGHRIDDLSVHRRRPTRPVRQALSARWADRVCRRPVIATAFAVIGLCLLAVPALDVRLGMPDASTQPHHTSGYTAHRILSDGFGPGIDASLALVVDPPRGDPGPAAQDMADRVRDVPGVARVGPAHVSDDGAIAVIPVQPRTGAQEPETFELVQRLRASTRGQDVLLGGSAAAAIDFAQLTADRLPLVVAVVVGLSLLLLVIVFRSVPLALKAGVLNLLSIGASVGVLVAVVQWGWGRQLLNLPAAMPIAAWVPMIMFPVLFGLSMDYEVFLISRIREAYDALADTRAAVRIGLGRVARVISAAAAIMIAVFLSVALATDVGVTQLGLGLAVAVLVDATLVRLVLVPAAMVLAGRVNWWLPAWLDRMLPATAIERAAD